MRAGRILDLGCGSYPYFLTQTRFQEKYGLDYSLKEENEGNGLILRNFDLAGGQPLPFPDNFFSVVTMLAVFEHLADQPLNFILKEIKRVLKSGGRYILTTPHPRSDKILKMLVSLKLVSAVEIEEHQRLYGHEEIAAILKAAGFLEEKMRFGYFECFLNNWAYADKD